MGNIKMCPQFLPFPHTDMTHVIGILSCKTWAYLFYIVNIMGADVLATQGAGASTTILLTSVNRNNSIPHVKG